MKFERKRHQQTFERPTILRNGKEQDLYRMIQENAEDTDLYKIEEKYHGLENARLDLNEIYADMTETLDIRDIYEKRDRAKEMWENLPLQIREKFNHDPAEFAENGIDWLKKEIEKNQPKVETQPAIQPTTEPTTEPTTKE